MLKKERELNHIKCPIKNYIGRKVWKTKIRTKGHKQKTVANMVDTNPPISIIILNVIGLNIPIKRQRLLKWIKKTNKNQLMLSIRNPL